MCTGFTIDKAMRTSGHFGQEAQNDETVGLIAEKTASGRSERLEPIEG
jgi:hypothetical protein